MTVRQRCFKIDRLLTGGLPMLFNLAGCSSASLLSHSIDTEPT